MRFIGVFFVFAFSTLAFASAQPEMTRFFHDELSRMNEEANACLLSSDPLSLDGSSWREQNTQARPAVLTVQKKDGMKIDIVVSLTAYWERADSGSEGPEISNRE